MGLSCQLNAWFNKNVYACRHTTRERVVCSVFPCQVHQFVAFSCYGTMEFQALLFTPLFLMSHYWLNLWTNISGLEHADLFFSERHFLPQKELSPEVREFGTHLRKAFQVENSFALCFSTSQEPLPKSDDLSRRHCSQKNKNVTSISQFATTLPMNTTGSFLCWLSISTMLLYITFLVKYGNTRWGAILVWSSKIKWKSSRTLNILCKWSGRNTEITLFPMVFLCEKWIGGQKPFLPH